MQTYRIEVGHVHGVKPANIVGAIANEAGLDPKYIGRIDIHDDYSTLDLPEGMPKELFRQLKTVSVSGQQLRISEASGRQPVEADFRGGRQAQPEPGRGGDRRAGEKSSSGKPPFKPKSHGGKHAEPGMKKGPASHRKGPKQS